MQEYQNCPPQKYFMSVFPRKSSWKEYPKQFIYSNRVDNDLPYNEIQTSKYTFLTFIPLNLMNQFSKMANMYFLLMAVLQTIQEISNSQGKPVILLPLTMIVIITALKDLYEDQKRKNEDYLENHSKANVLKDGQFQSEYWKNLQVGNIIRVNKNQQIPADILLLYSSDKQGICYLETKSLDGETNLKRKLQNKEFHSIFQDQNDCIIKQFSVQYDAPNQYLHHFQGNFGYQQQLISVDNNNFILRGCVLRNTDYIIGLVCYTGHFTKVMLNNVNARQKQSRVQQFYYLININRQTNSEILFILVLQCIMCLFASLSHALWYEKNIKMVPYFFIQSWEKENNFFSNFILRYGNWMLLFTNFVPISLLVTLEFVQLVQAIMIQNDPQMIAYNNNNFSPSVQTSNLNEELGQIHQIFADKTGTLTQNIMEFRFLIANGKSYGNMNIIQYIWFSNQLGEHHMNQDSSSKIPYVNFSDKEYFKLLKQNEQKTQEIRQCLILLSICHEIVVEQQDHKLEYNAASTDELALIHFAKMSGMILEGEDDNRLISLYDSQENKHIKFKLLETLEFSSHRKRMSVVAKNVSTNKIVVFSKGADSVIIKLLQKDMNEIERDNYIKTLNILNEYSKIGLRTLLLAQKEISESEYQVWKKSLDLAKTSLEERNEKIEKAYDNLEFNLQLIGATAIEDKLQQNVESTLEYLKRTGIKIWVLTGDKIETAINIGLSSKLLLKESENLIIDGQNMADIERTLEQHVERSSNSHQKFSLIIGGDALRMMQDKNDGGKILKDFIDLAMKCDAILACRVSPKQKRDVITEFIKQNPNQNTLAIGDGANDVNMITAAHIGVGIIGLEGQQAARASDYAIGEFQNLRRLLLVHGRECYRRNTMLILYNFFKNILLVTTQFWYGFVNGFSAYFLYDIWIFQLFNIIFTSAPIIIFAIFDSEFTDFTLFNHPSYYIQGMKNKLFGSKIFKFWILKGLYYALMTIYVTNRALNTGFVSSSGYTFDIIQAGALVYESVIILANLKIIIMANNYNILSASLLFLSVFSYFVIMFIVGIYPSQAMYQIIYRQLETPITYLAIFIIISFTILIDLAYTRQITYDYALKISQHRELRQKNQDEKKPLMEDSNQQFRLQQSEIYISINRFIIILIKCIIIILVN